MKTKIEWRLRAVTRYILTRYESPEEPDPINGMMQGTSVSQAGEYSNLELAVKIGLALVSDDAKRYPDRPVRFDDLNIPAPKVRCKMSCVSAWPTRAADGSLNGGGQVFMTAVYQHRDGVDGNAAIENRIFSKATPNATLNMQIENPEAFGRFKQGQAFYVDFVPVPEDVETLLIDTD